MTLDAAWFLRAELLWGHPNLSCGRKLPKSLLTFHLGLIAHPVQSGLNKGPLANRRVYITCSLVRPWVGLLVGIQSQARGWECSPTAQVQLRLPRQITAQGAEHPCSYGPPLHRQLRVGGGASAHGPELRCGAAILHQVSWSEVWYEVSARGGSVAGRLDSAQGKQGQTLISSPRCYFISREL